MSLAPFLQLIPEYLVRDGELGSANRRRHADLLVLGNSERVIVELKLSGSPETVRGAVQNLKDLMIVAGIEQGIVFAYPPSGGEVDSRDLSSLIGNKGRLIIVGPREEVASHALA